MPISDTVTRYGTVAPDQFQKPVVGESAKLLGLKYPVDKDPKRGYFSANSNLDLIKSNLNSLIRTERGERFMRTDFGCNLRRFLMEPLDSTLFQTIREEIVLSVRKYLKTVNIQKLQVFETASSQLKVNLFCSVKDTVATTFNIGIVI